MNHLQRAILVAGLFIMGILSHLSSCRWDLPGNREFVGRHLLSVFTFHIYHRIDSPWIVAWILGLLLPWFCGTMGLFLLAGFLRPSK